jgi:ribosome-associated protein
LPDPVEPQLTARSFDDARDLALRIADVISDTPAANTLVLDIHSLSPLADFFVICSGENERQLRAITRDIVEKLAAAGYRPQRTEGTAPAGWILLDFGEVIVHVFGAAQRAFYRLEELWSEAPTLLAIE